MSNVKTLEPCNTFGWDIYFVSIDAGAQVAIILLACRPCLVIVNLLGQVFTLGRAPRTKETLLDFREWCRVTSIPQVDELSTDIPDLGRHSLYIHLFVLRHSLYIYTRLLVCYCEEGKKKKKTLKFGHFSCWKIWNLN